VAIQSGARPSVSAFTICGSPLFRSFLLTLSLVFRRKYQKTVTGISSAMKSAFVGNEDFAMKDLMKSEFDLQYASRNYKFGLVPKVVSELVATTTHEFLAHDDTTYKMWTEAFDTVVT
jgi:hypothetical protein